MTTPSPPLTEASKKAGSASSSRAIQGGLSGPPDRDAATDSSESAPSLTAPCPEYEEREERLAKKELWHSAQVPHRHERNINRATAPAPEWLAKREELRKRLGSGFLVALIGERGNGKTQLACDLIFTVCDAKRSARYAKTMTFFMDIKASYREAERQTERDVLVEYERPRLLILDEVGVRGGSEWEDRLLVHLLDRRYDAMTDTLLVTNQTETDLRESLGSSVVDRMRETGGIAECAWPSFRTEQET